MTTRAAVDSATRRLAAAGVVSPRTDAELLAAHLLGVARSGLLLHLDAPPPAGFEELVARRAQRVPLQHLTGEAHFRTVTLSVGPGVFVPRPETEVLVDHALRLLRQSSTLRPLVVDLCAGSGAIARAVDDEFAAAEVHAVEVDDDAWPWLERNTRDTAVRAHHEDMADCLPSLDGRVDLVLANPPYIPAEAVPRDPEVAAHDPARALYSGVDGLDHVRMVERVAYRLLRPGGAVVVEHADEQGESAPQVFRLAGRWTDVVDQVDLAGRDRFVVARRGGL